MSLLAVCNVHTAGTIKSETAWYVCQRAGLLLPHCHSIYTFQSGLHIILPLTLKVLMNVSGHMANKGAYARGCLYGQTARQAVSLKQLNRSATTHTYYDDVITVASSSVNNQCSVTLVWYTCIVHMQYTVHMQYLLKHLRLHV